MYEIDKEKFGHFITEQRKAKGLTQKELAEHLFISNKAISKWETGVSIPDASLWIPLANLLGVTVTELLMCEKVQEVQMNSNQVEALVQKAMNCSENSSIQAAPTVLQRILIFVICILASCLEHVYLYQTAEFTSTLYTLDILSIIFGIYFLFIAKTKLPTYYDENKISSYSDGFFRLNMPGLTINNSNWPHLVRTGRIWSMAVLVGYPAIHIILRHFNCLSVNVETGIVFAIVLIGLFLPMYIVGLKNK